MSWIVIVVKYVCRGDGRISRAVCLVASVRCIGLQCLLRRICSLWCWSRSRCRCWSLGYTPACGPIVRQGFGSLVRCLGLSVVEWHRHAAPWGSEASRGALSGIWCVVTVVVVILLSRIRCLVIASIATRWWSMVYRSVIVSLGRTLPVVGIPSELLPWWGLSGIHGLNVPWRIRHVSSRLPSRRRSSGSTPRRPIALILGAVPAILTVDIHRTCAKWNSNNNLGLAREHGLSNRKWKCVYGKLRGPGRVRLSRVRAQVAAGVCLVYVMCERQVQRGRLQCTSMS